MPATKDFAGSVVQPAHFCLAESNSAAASRKVFGVPDVRPQQVPLSSGSSCLELIHVTASQKGCARHAFAQAAKLLPSRSLAERQAPLHDAWKAFAGLSSPGAWTA
mmetsp:Transcript_10320/g.32712  ORF Transcript_10320/g.32712 Transcript_10320/m.32712 type:complete len:106 (+) Transcript_10320:733-1050(+)